MAIYLCCPFVCFIGKLIGYMLNANHSKRIGKKNWIERRYCMLKISIFVPNYNEGRKLNKCINSIQKDYGLKKEAK